MCVSQSDVWWSWWLRRPKRWDVLQKWDRFLDFLIFRLKQKKKESLETRLYAVKLFAISFHTRLWKFYFLLVHKILLETRFVFFMVCFQGAGMERSAAAPVCVCMQKQSMTVRSTVWMVKTNPKNTKVLAHTHTHLTSVVAATSNKIKESQTSSATTKC